MRDSFRKTVLPLIWVLRGTGCLMFLSGFLQVLASKCPTITNSNASTLAIKLCLEKMRFSLFTIASRKSQTDLNWKKKGAVENWSLFSIKPNETMTLPSRTWSINLGFPLWNSSRLSPSKMQVYS